MSDNYSHDHDRNLGGDLAWTEGGQDTVDTTKLRVDLGAENGKNLDENKYCDTSF